MPHEIEAFCSGYLPVLLFNQFKQLFIGKSSTLQSNTMSAIENIVLVGEQSDYTTLSLCHFVLDRSAYKVSSLFSRSPQELETVVCEAQPHLFLLLPSEQMLQQFRTLRLSFPDTPILVIGTGDALLQYAPYLISGAAGYLTVQEIATELDEAIYDIKRRGLVANKYVRSALSNLTMLLDKEVIRISGLMRAVDEKEKQVLRILRDFPGISCETVGRKLYLSVETVNKRVQSILRKLHVQNRIELQHYLALYRPEGQTG